MLWILFNPVSIVKKSRSTCREEEVPERHVIESFEPFEEVSVDYVVNLPG
jgi:hypothetical protein